MASFDDIIALGSTPIPGDAPTGIEAKYEPEFEALKAEVDKLASVGGGEVAWPRVRQLAVGLLTSKSKDQLVASYLTAALLHGEGWPGLIAGLRLLDGLCRNFWDGMFPAATRLRARIAAFTWLIERVESWTRNHPASAADLAQVDEALAATETLYAACDEKLQAEGGSGLFGLQRVLREVRERLAVDAPAAPAEAAAATAAGAAPAANTAALAPGSPAARAEALRRLDEIAAYFAAAEPHSPIAPMLRRVRRWAGLDYVRLYQELLKHNQDSQERLWDTLGVDPAQAAAATTA
jgi:type VI secretion system protein VasJ